MTISNAIVAAMVAGAGGLLGYQVGARGLDEARTASADLHRALETQEREFLRAQQELARGASAVAADHQQALDRLEARHARDEQRLKAGNAGASQRAAMLDVRIGAIDREREALRRAAAADADAAASGAQRLAELDAERSGASVEKAGLDCLAVAVPAAQLAALRGD